MTATSLRAAPACPQRTLAGLAQRRAGRVRAHIIVVRRPGQAAATHAARRVHDHRFGLGSAAIDADRHLLVHHSPSLLIIASLAASSVPCGPGMAARDRIVYAEGVDSQIDQRVALDLDDQLDALLAQASTSASVGTRSP